MLNEITLHGYLGKDPELKEGEGQNGPYVIVSFSLAVSRDYGDETDWFYCSMSGDPEKAQGKRAKVIHKYFHKGSEIIVTGRMESYRSEHTTYWNVRVSDFNFCGKNDNRMSDQPIPEGFREVDEDEDFNLF